MFFGVKASRVVIYNKGSGNTWFLSRVARCLWNGRELAPARAGALPVVFLSGGGSAPAAEGYIGALTPLREVDYRISAYFKGHNRCYTPRFSRKLPPEMSRSLRWCFYMVSFALFCFGFVFIKKVKRKYQMSWSFLLSCNAILILDKTRKIKEKIYLENSPWNLDWTFR